MAFVIEQEFDQVQYRYDREGDVLYVSFGPPVPAVTVAIEDWFLIRLTPGGLRICGFTFIGFKRLFAKIRPDLLKELPERVERLKKARFVLRYSDEADTLAIRFEQEQPAYYERFDEDIYLERALMGGDIIGLKLTHYTQGGAAAVERVVAAALDALFAPSGSSPGPADALTRAFLEHIDLPRLLAAAA